MIREIYYTYELSPHQINEIYALHNHFYVKRGIGFEFEEWKFNLLKKYHNKASKKIQITIDNYSNIIGYSIFTEPIIINNEKWSIILEGGFLSNNSKNEFINMILDLTHKSSKNINYISEISVKSRLVLHLMKKSGFVQINNENIDYVFNMLIGKNSYRFIKENQKLLINRKTKLTDNYIGNIIAKRSEKKQNVKKEQYILEETI